MPGGGVRGGQVFIVGLAYDFCVSFTAKDAVARGVWSPGTWCRGPCTNLLTSETHGLRWTAHLRRRV